MNYLGKNIKADMYQKRLRMRLVQMQQNMAILFIFQLINKYQIPVILLGIALVIGIFFLFNFLDDLVQDKFGGDDDEFSIK